MKGTGKRNYSETRQAVCLLLNIMAHSRNQFCRGKNSAFYVVELYVPVNYTKVLNVAQNVRMAILFHWQQ